jgi:class 3 adenylate cyclase
VPQSWYALSLDFACRLSRVCASLSLPALVVPQFADIVGFTAWSSAREPSQVFTLLETVYQAFDEIAKRRRVFKVRVVATTSADMFMMSWTHAIFIRWKRLEIAMWQ